MNVQPNDEINFSKMQLIIKHQMLLLINMHNLKTKFIRKHNPYVTKKIYK